jgi:outer membrane receptor protein involved in Fe transport
LALCAAAAALAPAAAANEVPGRDTILVTPVPEGLQGRPDSASEGAIEDDRIERRALSRPAAVLEAIPGVVVTQHSGSGKANQYFLRGFNLDHGTDFAVHVDGMPVNMPSHGHGQGYADLNFLIPELIDHVHYRKGPYSAEDGDFSAAGAAHVDLKRAMNGGAAQVTPGSFGYLRSLFTAGRDLADGSLIGALELGRDNGPWVNPESLRKLNALLRYTQGSDRNGFSLTAMAYHARWNATDQIPLRAADDGRLPRFGAVDSTDGGRSSRSSVSGEWNRSDDAGRTRAGAYLIRSNLNLFSNFTYFLRDPANGDQFEQVDRRGIAGGEIARSWNTPFEGRQVEHALGARLRVDDIGQVGLFNTAARVRLGTVRSDAVKQSSLGLYYQATIPWTRWLRGQLGLRGDFYRFRVDSDNPANSGSARAALLSPKLGFAFGPWAETETFVNYGRGFHSNDARGTTIAVDPATGAPASRVQPLVRATGGELGMRAAPMRGLQTSVALWRLELASELVFTGDAGTTETKRPSRRQGIEWANTYKPNALVTLDLDLTLSQARFIGDDPAAPGHRIPGAMDKTLSTGIAYGGREGWGGELRLRYFGPRPLIEDGSQRSPASSLVNARIGYSVNRQYRVGLDVLNLFNRRVDDITYFYTSRLPGEPAAGIDDKHFHPAEPRTLRLTAVVNF